jgi:septation ring formation regulator EzrA
LIDEHAKALKALAKAVDKLADEIAAQRDILRQIEDDAATARARLDVLITRVAAFERDGAVLILQRPLEDQLVPEAKT